MVIQEQRSILKTYIYIEVALHTLSRFYMYVYTYVTITNKKRLLI